MGDQQIILGDRLLDSDDVSLIYEAKDILLPQTCSLALYRACKAGSARLFPNYDKRFECPGKIGQHFLFETLLNPLFEAEPP